MAETHASESDKVCKRKSSGPTRDSREYRDAFVDVSGERWTKYCPKDVVDLLNQGAVMIELSGRVIYLL